MKQLAVLILLLLTILPIARADESVTVDGIKYTLLGDRTLSCRADNKKALVDVTIPETVKVNGIDYYVSMVEKRGFLGCKNMRSIVLPNSIKRFESMAFWNCENLESAVLPDDAEAKVDWGNYGYGDKGIFAGCKKLAQVRGNDILYPHYVVYDAFHKCNEVPFFKTIIEMGAAEMTNMKLSRSFDEFASLRIKDPVESWQRKKDYETMAQWEARVNDANRKKMIDEAIAEARGEYVRTFAPPTLKGTLEEYNSEYGFFPVFVGSMGNVYAKVPPEEAEAFASAWDKVQLKPVYGILDNSLAILSCTFMLDGKEYKSANSYAEDELTSLSLNITPLAAVREYEQMMASGNVPDEPVRRFDPDVIDIDIPSTTAAAANTFAVIIGNENYQRVAPVEYAMNDARIFSKYCSRTLGIPEDNVRTYYNATFGDFVAAFDDITAIAAAYKGDINIIFYYAGHGMPDDSNRNAYLIPVDATGTQPEVCYPLARLYEQLGKLKARSVVAFIDACFSGSLRGDGMLASARGIRLKPKDIDASGNLVVLSAASGDQAAFPYHEKSHGLFSYYLLKKINDTKGDVTLGELADFITDNVSKQSIVVNKKPQVPSVKWSADISDTWKSMKLRD